MATSQDRISDLEKQIISLQRELDEARRQSTSMWCKIHDLCTSLDFPEDASTLLTDEVSKIVKTWVNDQRSKVNRRYSSLGSLPPYTDCLNDIIVSISNPEVEPELAPYSYEMEGEQAWPVDDVPMGGRIPPPPPPNLVSSHGTFEGPPKMMKVNVPRPKAPEEG